MRFSSGFEEDNVRDDFTFTTEELNRLKDLHEASKRYGLNWVFAVSTFPAETDWERYWKARTLAGIRLVEAMISEHA